MALQLCKVLPVSLHVLPSMKNNASKHHTSWPWHECCLSGGQQSMEKTGEDGKQGGGHARVALPVLEGQGVSMAADV